MSNKIIDYISGTKINSTPEELEAVQPLAQELVEVYGYNKDEIKTHPQFRISLSPSDEKKPVVRSCAISLMDICRLDTPLVKRACSVCPRVGQPF